MDEKTKSILEIYKLHVEMADRVSQRRGIANNWMMTLHSFLFASAGFLFDKTSDFHLPLLVVLCFIGVGLSFVWKSLITSYKKLNTAKFQVINKIEEEYLPVQPFVDEYEFYTRDKRKDFSQVEILIPKLLIIIYPTLFLLVIVMKWKCFCLFY